MSSYFDKQIALFQVQTKKQTDIFKRLAQELFAVDAVNDEFFEKVEEREKIFPTGLLINGIGVAIPHTDSDYVHYSQVAFLSLQEPIMFKEMGNLEKKVPVQLVFMLALKEPHEQLTMLQKLIDMFQKEGVLKKLLAVQTKEAFQKILAENALI